jgi:ribosomal protein S12 methylthiotransferase
MSHGRTRTALPVLAARTAASTPPASALPGASVRLITLGCDKNTVDSERLLARLSAAGARPTDGDADVIIVNTCGFIETAREESIDAILEALQVRDSGRARAVVALGCMVQRYKQELVREVPEVDLFLGLTEVDRLLPELRRRGLLAHVAHDTPTMERPLRMLGSGMRHTSFLKISEGCDHTCAFCAIPLMRGKHASTPVDVLVREAVQLERAGVVEVGIVSQDSTWYGRDWRRAGDREPGTGRRSGDGNGVAGDLSSGSDSHGDGFFVGRVFEGMAGHTHLQSAERAAIAAGASPASDLTGLLAALLEHTGIPWFRLFYMYPSGIRRELVEFIAMQPRILNYLDMPIQHGSDAVLTRMRRPERRQTIRERVGWLRAAIPDITLRTTVIVGFPGETEDDFEAMLELLEELRFDQLGAFAYSIEEGTRAAVMDGQVPEPVKRERLERLLDLQRSISLERNESRVGSDVTVLVDRVTGRDSDAVDEGVRGAVGRTAGQALEIDGVVHLGTAHDIAPGDFVRARITEAYEQDLVAEVVARHV